MEIVLSGETRPTRGQGGALGRPKSEPVLTEGERTALVPLGEAGEDRPLPRAAGEVPPTGLTVFAFTADPQLGTIDTPNGKVTFLQAVGVTAEEKGAMTDSSTAQVLQALAAGNPLLVTDPARTSEPIVTVGSCRRAAGGAGGLRSDNCRRPPRNRRESLTTVRTASCTAMTCSQ
ncbi:suppressor of fused domain protein [Streptomyces sp. NPDC046931]|uniref:suppressor of fused domain protein n=1 Tax=Streptomyces sp. NPDC046931 TaxID=3154806 RepID=UPI0033D6ADCE